MVIPERDYEAAQHLDSDLDLVNVDVDHHPSVKSLRCLCVTPDRCFWLCWNAPVLRVYLHIVNYIMMLQIMQ